MYKLHNHCRACGYAKDTKPQGIKAEKTPEKLIPVFDLGLQPLANDFCKANDEHGGFAPLEVLFCPRCSLAQLSVVVDPDILYRNYKYVTSTSDMMKNHFQILYEDLTKQRGGKLGHVLEIGSNDGQFLKFLSDKPGVRMVAGIDPAENLCAIAREQGIKTICSKWNSRIGPNLPWAMDTIIARHVFCHIDDWQDFVDGLESASHKNTMVAIEIPYAGDLLNINAFDTIYHEHLSYPSIKSINKLLEFTKFMLVNVIHYKIHGGAIVLILRRRDSDIHPDVGIDNDAITEQDWRKFAFQSHKLITDLKNTVLSLHTEGKTICGFGASAKSTVWINACGFTKRQIKFICDCTTQKQYCSSPGSDIPIVDEGALLRELPSHTIIFAWNYVDEILQKQKLYRDKGGKFIIPVPAVRIV